MAAAVVAIVVGVSIWAPWGEAPEPAIEVVPNRVAVVPLENRTGDPSLDTLGVMAADLIVQRFTETGAADVMPLTEAIRDTASQQTGGEQTSGWNRILQLARQRGAALTLAGAYYMDGDNLRPQARLVETITDDLIYAFEPVVTSREAPSDGIEALRERVVAAVAAHLHPNLDLRIVNPPSSYEAYVTFKQAAIAKNRDEYIAQLRRSYSLDPGFCSAWLVAALDQFVIVGDFDASRRELGCLEEHLDRMTPFEQMHVDLLRCGLNLDLQCHLNALRRMLQLAPDVKWIRFNVAVFAIFLNRPGEAIKTLEPDVLSITSDPASESEYVSSLYRMALALHMVGDYERELEYAELGVKLVPDWAVFYGFKARALAAMGDTDGVNRVVEEFLRVQTKVMSKRIVMAWIALELRAHGHREAGDQMAARAVERFETHADVLENSPEETEYYCYALWMVGRLDQLEELIVQSVTAGSREPVLRASLGWIAARRGNREEAMQISDDLSVGDDPRALAEGTYWRASIAAHLGEKDRAVELLSEAFSNGYRYDNDIRCKSDFEPLWDYPPFQELIRPKG